jgi:formylglycine-generating enzyme required for sulfatase activity
MNLAAPLLATLALVAGGCRSSHETPGSSERRAVMAAVAAELPPALAGDVPAPVPPAALPGPSACPEGMARIPAGSYRMQKRRDRTTSVAAFCIDVIEVTVAAYKECVRERKCSPECLAQGRCSAVPTQAEWGDPGENSRASVLCNGDREDRQDHPVNCVSWDESKNYCEAHGKRLPRPEEWEWAARRADPRTWYPWGNAPPDDQLCWSPKAHRRHSTCVAGSTPGDRTPQGVFDMAGNVGEWVDGSEPAGSRVRTAFGASFWSMDDGYVSGTLGGVEVLSERNETIGFRCTKDAGS